jgi:hypothetical protein
MGSMKNIMIIGAYAGYSIPGRMAMRLMKEVQEQKLKDEKILLLHEYGSSRSSRSMESLADSLSNLKPILEKSRSKFHK